MKLSKANEFYPGTTERVCLLTGSLEGKDYFNFIDGSLERFKIVILVCRNFGHPDSRSNENQGKAGSQCETGHGL